MKGLIYYLLISESDRRGILSQYWADKVAVVWTSVDVHTVQDDFNEDEQASSLSEEQAQSILQRVFDKHDATSEGITSGELALLE